MLSLGTLLAVPGRENDRFVDADDPVRPGACRGTAIARQMERTHWCVRCRCLHRRGCKILSFVENTCKPPDIAASTKTPRIRHTAAKGYFGPRQRPCGGRTPHTHRPLEISFSPPTSARHARSAVTGATIDWRLVTICSPNSLACPIALATSQIRRHIPGHSGLL